MNTNNFSLEITCLDHQPNSLGFRDLNNNEVIASYKRILPNIFDYQRDEIRTLANDSPDHELDMSKSLFRWLARELIKNTKFFFRTLDSTYRFEFPIVSNMEFPLQVHEKSGGSVWVSRSSVQSGIAPSDLEGTLEESRLKNPFQFSALVRLVADKNPSYSCDGERDYVLQALDDTGSVYREFTLETSVINNAEIFHAKIVASENQILAMSNRRTVLIPRKPAFVNLHGPKYRIFRSYKGSRNVEKAIYVGTSTNWFHFIVELAARLVEIPRKSREGIPVIIDSAAHRNIAKICELMTGVPPIQLSLGESAKVDELLVVREFGVIDPIDPIQRSRILRDFRNEIITQEVPKLTEDVQRIYIRRSRNLYRPLQNERAISKLLHGKGFKSIYPENYALTDLIQIMQSANFIIAESGAAITNLMFAREGTKFAEILPAIAIVDFWKNFVGIFGIEYSSIQGEGSRVGPRGYAYDGYKVSVKALRELLQKWGIE